MNKKPVYKSRYMIIGTLLTISGICSFILSMQGFIHAPAWLFPLVTALQPLIFLIIRAWFSPTQIPLSFFKTGKIEPGDDNIEIEPEKTEPEIIKNEDISKAINSDNVDDLNSIVDSLCDKPDNSQGAENSDCNSDGSDKTAGN